MSLLLGIVVGMIAALLAGAFWALCTSRTALAEAVAALMAICSVLYFSLPAFLDLTPGTIARRHGWIESTTDAVLLAVVPLTVGALGFLALVKSGLVARTATHIARRRPHDDTNR